MASAAELVVRIVADTSDAQKGIDDVGTKTSKMGGAVRSAALPAAAALTAVAGAAFHAASAAAEDAQSQAILKNTLEKTTGANEAQVESVESAIAAMSSATGVADDELRPAMGNLLRATNDTATSQDALSAALDISAATGKSVESVSVALAKAYGGSTAGLKKLVPSLDEATLASGDMEAIMAELAETTGGSAAAAADTAAGKTKIMQNSMAEAEESIGAGLLPIQEKLAAAMEKVGIFAQEHPALFQAIAIAVAALAAAILVLNVAMTVYTIVTTLAGSATIAAWAAALWPILLVIAAIAAVVVIVTLLWKKNETFRNIVTAAWNGVKNAIDAVGNAIGWVVTKVGDLINKIGQISVPGFIKTAFEAIRSAVESAWNWVGNLIAKIGNITVPGFIEDAFNKIKGAVEGAWNKVGDLVAKIGDISVPGTVKAAIDAIAGSIDWVIGKIESLIGWLSRIKVPSINLPGPLSLPGTTAAPSVTRFAAPGVATPRATSSSGQSVSIVVNGALDPEATARQIRRILDGHNRRVGLVT